MFDDLQLTVTDHSGYPRAFPLPTLLTRLMLCFQWSHVDTVKCRRDATIREVKEIIAGETSTEASVIRLKKWYASLLTDTCPLLFFETFPPLAIFLDRSPSLR